MASPALATTTTSPLPRWHWNTTQFLRLAETGIFDDTDAELIEGDIVPMEPPGPLHAGSVNPIYEVLKTAFKDGFVVRTEQPLEIGTDSLPQPDIAVCAGTFADFRNRYPQADDTRLIVEISDTSIAYDRNAKAELYASAGIPEYWILNLREQQLEVLREPDAQNRRFRWQRLCIANENITPLHAVNAVAVADLLG